MSPGSSKKANPEAASNTKYNVGDVVLAKIRGFPAWPGIIMDDKNVPKAVLSERPASKHRDLYTIRFFPAADYHWAASRDLSLLTQKQIEAYLQDPHKKSGELKEAYKIAQDPTEWNEEQNRIVENHERSLLDAAEEEEENQDQLQDEDEDQDDDAEPESKKRKRDGAGSGKVRESASDKQRKKQKLTEAKPKIKPGDAKAPSSGRKATNGEEAEEEVDPETKKVKDWRHKLQRAFLSKDSVLNAADMPSHDATFKVVEAYDGITSDQLKISKIGKVMKRIVLLPDIPRDDEFKFKERAQKLVEKWSTILNGEPSQDAPAPDTAKPTTTELETSALTSKPEETGATADTVEESKPSNDA